MSHVVTRDKYDATHTMGVKIRGAWNEVAGVTRTIDPHSIAGSPVLTKNSLRMLEAIR
jgi:hypothetical protein